MDELIKAVPASYLAGSGMGPIELLIFQPTPFCNIDCTYCYLPHRSSKMRLTPALVTETCRKAVEEGLVGAKVSVVWHAGEPLTIPARDWGPLLEACAPLSAAGTQVLHCFQTNGTLIDASFIELFKRSDVLVCVSIDGPQDLHDAHRRDRKGNGTFDSVMRGISKLREAGIAFDTISVVSRGGAGHAKRLYHFLAELGVRSAGFNMDEADGSNATSSWSIADQDLFQAFFAELFAIHMQEMKLRVREFDGVVSTLRRQDPVNVNQQARPFGILTVGVSGQFGAFSPEMLDQRSQRLGDLWVGNVADGRLTDQFVAWANRTGIYEEITRGLRQCEASCDIFSLCGGGAPSNKFAETGRFDVAETSYCKLTKQAVYEGFCDACSSFR